MSGNFHRTVMTRDAVIKRLRDAGCRITKRREILPDIILQQDCACCKEIYYKASSVDFSIGASTVYRMINLFKETGSINRKNMYRIMCGAGCRKSCGCTITLDDNTVHKLSTEELFKVISAGLRQLGYTRSGNVSDFATESCQIIEIDKAL